MHGKSTLCLQRVPIWRNRRNKHSIANLEVFNKSSDFYNFTDRLMAQNHVLSVADCPRPNCVYVGGAGSQCKGLADSIHRAAGGCFLFNPAGISDLDHCESFHYKVFLSLFIFIWQLEDDSRWWVAYAGLLLPDFFMSKTFYRNYSAVL